MPTLTKAEVEANYITHRGDIIAARVPDLALDDDFKVDNFFFATSEYGFLTVYGSIYFKSSRRIRLCHDSRPKVSSKKNGLYQYCLLPNGERYYHDFGRRFNNKDLVDRLAAMNGICDLKENGGTLVEFWEFEGRHISRGRPVNVTLTQKQINFLYLAAIMESNSLMKQCWLAADLPY
ncbi:hypothetical protein GBZ26_13845 [Azospirillum formosense]|uniref:Uncharacterized protein n=1 Tax=Azospirillum formosense TaxID=861533 RepID=A0ABX2KUE0_9PROT|nr:hypothetical protein [Azospirillum formosense]MBY3751881.1 hypothetical protein [Azospirillum formosense]NUB20289.1 hypothetical protein [Azospirillum formosense]